MLQPVFKHGLSLLRPGQQLLLLRRPVLDHLTVKVNGDCSTMHANARLVTMRQALEKGVHP